MSENIDFIPSFINLDIVTRSEEYLNILYYIII